MSLSRARRRHEHQAVRAGEVAREHSDLARLEVDLVEVVADRGIEIFRAQPGRIDLDDLVRVLGGDVEGAGARRHHDGVIGRAGGRGQLDEALALIGGAGGVDEGVRLVRLAGQDEIPVRQQLQRIRVADRQRLVRLPGHEVRAGVAVAQDALRLELAEGRVAVEDFRDHRIARVRAGLADEDGLAGEHDIVEAAAGIRAIGVARSPLQLLADLMRRGIDQRQRRIRVLVLQRPDVAGGRIKLQPVHMAAERVARLDRAELAVFDDGAAAAGSGIGRAARAVAPHGPDGTVGHRERVRRGLAPRCPRENALADDLRHLRFLLLIGCQTARRMTLDGASVTTAVTQEQRLKDPARSHRRCHETDAQLSNT